VFDAVKDNTVEMATHGFLLFFRQGSDLRFRLRHSLRNEQSPAWMPGYRYGNGGKLLGEFFGKSNIVPIPLR
jgi:TRAP-type mannitol/chloroaromatic compound transport system substrate-binding protein